MSIQANFFTLYLRAMRFKSRMNPGLQVEGIRSMDVTGPPTSFTSGCTYEDQQMDGTTVTWVHPPDVRSEDLLIYVHGGAYVGGISLLHWGLLSRLCAELGRTGLMIHYRLAPEHPYPQGLQDVVGVYQEVLQTSPPQQISMLGDSAGGGLLLGSVFALHEQGQPLPAKLVLLSPWLDITMQNPAIDTLEKFDPILSRPGLVEAGQLYAGDEDPAHHHLSPLNGDLAMLPPILLQVGTHEIFLPDIRLFREKASRAGVDVTYTEAPKMFHVYTAIFPFIPEAKEAVREVVEFLA